MNRKAILLAGGTGTRLHPLTVSVSKQMLPVYDKPMIYYPLSVLMLAGIRDVLVITTPEHAHAFRALLGDGTQIGMSIKFAVQERPEGIAQAFLVGRDFLGDAPAALILGDNVFYGDGLQELCAQAGRRVDKATVFAYHVTDPERYGVVEFDTSGRALSVEEKPAKPRSNFAVTGLYFFPASVSDVASNISPSPRGELEITAVVDQYLAREQLFVERLGRGFAWLDTGTPESLLEASQFIATLEHRQGLKVGCLEEIALNAGWIDRAMVVQAASNYGGGSYAQYLRKVGTGD